MKSLSDIQKEIYSVEKKILEEYKKSIDIKKTAIKASQIEDNDKNIKAIAEKITKNSLLREELNKTEHLLKEELTNRFLKLDKASKELATLIEQANQEDKKLKPQEIENLNKWKNQLSSINKEFKDHKKEVYDHKTNIEQANKKAELEQKNLYKTEKNKLFSNVPSLLSSPESINKILKPLAEKKDNSSISLGDVSKSAFSGGLYALNNLTSITNLLVSAPYYIAEAKKIPNGTKDEKETSFFLKLLEDKDTVKFVKENSNSIGKLVDTIAPTITSIVLREVGKLDELKKTLKNTEKQLGTISELQEALNKLTEKAKNREFSEIEKATIKNLNKGIRTIQSLENRIKIATGISELKSSGIDSKYISEKILPIALNPLKELLKNPQDSVDIGNLIVKIVTSDSPAKELTESFNSIANKIDIKTILDSSNFKDFLSNEGPKLAKIASVVINNSDILREQTEKFGLPPKLIEDTIITFSLIASTLLSDTEKINKAYKSFFDLSLSSSKENLSKVSTLIGDVSSILLKDDTMNSLKKTTPNFLREHQEEIGQFVSNIPKNLENTLIGKFVDGVKKDSVVGITKASSNVLISVLENLSNKEMQQITSSVEKLIIAEPEQTKDLILDIGTSIVNILENKEISSSLKEFGEFIDKNHEEVNKIVTNVINNTPLKEKLEEFGVTNKLISDSIPLITSVAKEGLANTESFKDIYENVKTVINNENSQETKNAVSSIIGKISDIALKDELLNDLKEKIPVILENKEDIVNLALSATKLVRNTEAGKFIEGLEDKVIGESTKFATNLTSTILQNVDNKDIRSITSSIQQLIIAEPEDRLGLVLNLGNHAGNILSNEKIASSLNETADFISKNNKEVSIIANNFIKNNNALNKRMQEWGIGEDVISETIQTGTKILSESMPTISKIAPIILKDEDFKKIINDIKNTVKGPESEQPKNIMNIVSSVISLKDKNPEVKKALEENLPKILTENSEIIGKTIDNVLHKTEVGKKLQLDTKKIVEVIAKKIPALSELSTLFNQKSYGAMIPKIVKFAFDKEFLSLAIDSGMKALKNQKIVRESLSEIVSTLKDKKKLDEIKRSVKGFVKEVASNTTITSKDDKKSLQR